MIILLCISFRAARYDSFGSFKCVAPKSHVFAVVRCSLPGWPQSVQETRDGRPPRSPVRGVDGERHALSAVHPILQPAPQLFQGLGLGLVDALVFDVLRFGHRPMVAHHPVVRGRGLVLGTSAVRLPSVFRRQTTVRRTVRRRRHRCPSTVRPRMRRLFGRVFLAVARLVLLHDHGTVTVVHVAVVGRGTSTSDASATTNTASWHRCGHAEVGKSRVQAPDDVLLPLDDRLALVQQLADGPLLAAQPRLEQQQVRCQRLQSGPVLRTHPGQPFFLKPTTGKFNFEKNKISLSDLLHYCVPPYLEERYCEE